MILERGDMWSVFGKTDLLLITTNPIRRKDGAVVMGRGIAKQVSERFRKLPFEFGEILEGKHGLPSNCDLIGFYGNPPQRIGYFMVKSHWELPAELTIIQDSITELVHSWQAPELFKRIDLNFPGIGNGRLKREDVLPLLEQLPDNVHIWEY